MSIFSLRHQCVQSTLWTFQALLCPCRLRPPASATNNSLRATKYCLYGDIHQPKLISGKSEDVLILLFHVSTHVVYSQLNHLTIHSMTKRKCRKSSYSTIIGRSCVTLLEQQGMLLERCDIFQN